MRFLENVFGKRGEPLMDSQSGVGEGAIEKNPEKGENITLVVRIMRHGDRTPEGNLEDFGRQRTIEKARGSVSVYEQFDVIKAFGSTAGPKTVVEGEEMEMQRSLETAHIFAKELAVQQGTQAAKTRPRDILNYETSELPPPGDYFAKHKAFIKEFIRDRLGYADKEFGDLSDEEKKQVNAYADANTVGWMMSTDSEDAISVNKETAGTYAVLIERYVKMIQEKIDSNKKILYVLGSHTGMMEPFLSQVAVWKDKDGGERHGATLDELGGIFDPSEGFDIVIKTDKNGKLEDLLLRFDKKDRLGGEARLDMGKIRESAEFYRSLHVKKDESKE